MEGVKELRAILCVFRYCKIAKFWQQLSLVKLHGCFTGGLPKDVTGVPPSITIMYSSGKGSTNTLIEMDYCVLDFVVVTDSPYASDYQVI